jgi:hypothetical protein
VTRRTINGVFLLFYIFIANRGPTFGIVGAVGMWFALTGAVAASGIRTFPISVAAWILLTISCYLVAERRMKIPSQRRLPFSATSLQILCRALFGGGVIALAVLLSKLSGPVYGGIFATFPAMFVSTLIVSYRTGGATFSRAVAKSLLYRGMVNIPVYAILVRVSYPWAGLAGGTAIAFAVTTGVGYVTFRLMMARAS